MPNKSKERKTRWCAECQGGKKVITVHYPTGIMYECLHCKTKMNKKKYLESLKRKGWNYTQ